MATKFTLEHSFPDIPVDVFEKHLNHPDLIKALDKMPAFRSRDLVSKTDNADGSTTWRFKVVAGGDVPPAVRKVLSEDMLTWHEDTKFVPNEHTIHWTITPLAESAKKLLTSHGIWKLIPSGAGTRRVIEGNIDVKVPLIGKVVEQYLAGELKRNYDVEPDIQRSFYKKMMAG
ncbi:MAG TPA: DUF2505 domain-containing protein [Myxococcota bacterium]